MNTRFVSLGEVASIPVPASEEEMRKYQAVPHMRVINTIKEHLRSRRLVIEKELYKVGRFGNQIYGSILTDMRSDSDIGGAIHFVNSYDKSKKLEIVAGSIVFMCENGMVRLVGISESKRKHVGGINEELAEMVVGSIQNLEEEYNYLKEAKERLKEIEVSPRLQAELAGRIFIEENILSPTQMAALKTEISRGSSPFGRDNAWRFYNDVTSVLKLSHPVEYLKDHAEFHSFMMENV